jgi:hypothetical protein
MSPHQPSGPGVEASYQPLVSFWNPCCQFVNGAFDSAAAVGMLAAKPASARVVAYNAVRS